MAINLQELMMKLGAGAGNTAGQEAGNVMGILSQLTNLAQQTNAIPQAQTQLPQMAIDEGQKVLKKFYKTSAEEAVQTPGGAEALAQQVSQPMQAESQTQTVTTPTQPAQQPTTQQPAAAPPVQKQGMSMLQQMLKGGATGAAWGMAPEMMQGKNELDKIRLTADLKYITDAVGSKLKGSAASPEALKLGANVELGLEQVDGLINSFNKDKNLFSFTTTFNNPSAQVVKTAVTNLQDTLGRMRSGGAINEEELKTFSSLLPTLGIKGKFETPENVKFKLQSMRKMLASISNGLNPQVASRQANFITQAIESGYKPSEIQKFMSNRK